MTIKELCKKQTNCSVCLYLPICGDSPEEYVLADDLEVTNAIIETAKALEQQPCYNSDEWCKTCSEYNQEKHCCPRYNKVIRNAVEEIKQHCEDAVSRQAVLDLIVANHTELNGVNVVMYSPLCKDIKQLPPVTPQPKTGHWIVEKGGSYLGMRNGHCSCCKDYYTNDWNEMNYCPNCGSFNGGVKNGNE